MDLPNAFLINPAEAFHDSQPAMSGDFSVASPY
jgi:hypothetical protein